MRSRSTIGPPAPPRAHDDGGGGGWAWLVTAQGVFEAQLIRGSLEAAGIAPVVLDASDPSPGAWMFLSGNVNALVRVFVPKAMLDAARLVLLEAGYASADPPTEDVPTSRGWRWWVWLGITVAIVSAFVLATWHNAVR